MFGMSKTPNYWRPDSEDAAYTSGPRSVLGAVMGSGANVYQGEGLLTSALDAAEALLGMANGLDLQTKEEIFTELRRYREEYPDSAWRGSGRLARLGLPRPMVHGIRHLKRAVTSVLALASQ